MAKRLHHKSLEELTKKNIEAIEMMEAASNAHRTFGDRVADGFATAVGSWHFIIIQSVLLAIWVALNGIAWMRHWDPYPFILLNLVLSFQAAYASPIIMMSQNRQARLSERRNQLELQINLLAEQENTETLKLLHRICHKLNINLDDEADVEALEQPTKPQEVIEEIERTVEGRNERISTVDRANISRIDSPG